MHFFELLYSIQLLIALFSNQQRSEITNPTGK